jgi:hypothetical protein
MIWRALQRARLGILTVALTYMLSVAVGIAMVHGGNGFALRYRDKIVYRAHETSAILKALRNHRPMTAASMDFAGNLVAGTASTLSGYWAPAVYPIAIYRGWIGGIVSVDDEHLSRLAQRSNAIYYLSTLLLQLIPYSLAGGAGVNIGLARVRRFGDYSGPRVLGVPKEALLDAARIYLLIVPLFFIASTFEFFAIPDLLRGTSRSAPWSDKSISGIEGQHCDAFARGRAGFRAQRFRRLKPDSSLEKSVYLGVVRVFTGSRRARQHDHLWPALDRFRHRRFLLPLRSLAGRPRAAADEDQRGLFHRRPKGRQNLPVFSQPRHLDELRPGGGRLA